MVQSVLVNTRKKEFQSMAVYREELIKFADSISSISEEEKLAVTPNPFVDEYFDFVAWTGRPELPWSDIRIPFIWTLERRIDNMHKEEIEEEPDSTAKQQLRESAYIETTKTFILQKASSFDGTPFTIQRLCELITTPRRHYHVTEKYLRALEKNVNVVTTITESGDRISGVEAFENVELDSPVPVERNFIVSVDELDDPLPVVENGVERKKSVNGSAAHRVPDGSGSISECSMRLVSEEVNEDVNMQDVDTTPSSSRPDEETEPIAEAHSSSEEHPNNKLKEGGETDSSDSAALDLE